MCRVPVRNGLNLIFKVCTCSVTFLHWLKWQNNTSFFSFTLKHCRKVFLIFNYINKNCFLILILKIQISIKRQCYYASFLSVSAVHVEKACHDLLCAPVCRKRCIGYACFLAWGVFLAAYPLFSRLHLKYFLECLPFQPPWKQLAFCWSFMGKQIPVEYFCDSFYLPSPPSSNADECLFHHCP